MINTKSGNPILNLSEELAIELNIKPGDSIEPFRDQIPDVTFADIFDQLFDSIPFTSNKHYAIYNNILIDIRNASKKELDTIEIEKTDIETLKTIFEKAVINKPQINRSVGFILEVIEQCIADIINENNTHKIEN